SLRSGDSLLSSSTLSLHRLFYRTRIFPVKKESQSPSFLSLSFFTGGSLSPDSGSSAPQASPPRSLPVSFPSSLFCDGCAFLPHTEKAQKCPLCLSKRHTLRIDQRDRIMGRTFQRDHAQAASLLREHKHLILELLEPNTLPPRQRVGAVHDCAEVVIIQRKHAVPFCVRDQKCAEYSEIILIYMCDDLVGR